MKFGMKPIPERLRTSAYMKSIFGLKPVKPVLPVVVAETEPEPEPTGDEVLYFYVTWEPY